MLNTQAHGHLHELVGGTWSTEVGEVASDATDAVLPFLHTIQVIPFVELPTASPAWKKSSGILLISRARWSRSVLMVHFELLRSNVLTASLIHELSTMSIQQGSLTIALSDTHGTPLSCFAVDWR